jgi:hypothetical protein
MYFTQRSFQCFLLFLILVWPLIVRAQFQAPTDEELKMTSDPKAPGAAAVYLYREETTNAGARLKAYYARIKVLTEKGKDLATVKIPFVRGFASVGKVEGRTIHSDGTVIPLNVKPEDLVSFKSKSFQEDTLVFTLPSVEVGSVLEYRLQTKFNNDVRPPTWDLQCPYFIAKEHFAFYPDTSGGYWMAHGRVLNNLAAAVTPPNSPASIQSGKGVLTVDLTDVPPIPDDDWMPPTNTVEWRAEIFYTYAHTSQEFWDAEVKYWASETDAFTKVTGTIKKAASSLVASDDTDERKARKIYVAVMKLDNTDFSREKSEAERKKEKLKEIHGVDDVWKNQGGPGNSIALLYVALAQAAGLKAWPMQVVDRSYALFDRDYFTAGQLQDYIAVVKIGGMEVYLDPAQKGCPFGTLHWTHSLAGGFRESESGPVLSSTPSFGDTDNQVKRIADVSVDTEGNVTGTAHIELKGPEALYWRQQSFGNDENGLKKKIQESIKNDLPDGVDATVDHLQGLEDYESNLMIFFNLSGKAGLVTGKHFFLPGLLFETRAKHPFVAQAKRATSIDVHFPTVETDNVVYHLPQGYKAESSPHTSNVEIPGLASLRITSVAKGDTLEVTRDFSRSFTVLAPQVYDRLHDFYLDVATADQQQVVLVRDAATKGN